MLRFVDDSALLGGNKNELEDLLNKPYFCRSQKEIKCRIVLATMEFNLKQTLLCSSA